LGSFAFPLSYFLPFSFFYEFRTAKLLIVLSSPLRNGDLFSILPSPMSWPILRPFIEDAVMLFPDSVGLGLVGLKPALIGSPLFLCRASSLFFSCTLFFLFSSKLSYGLQRLIAKPGTALVSPMVGS